MTDLPRAPETPTRRRRSRLISQACAALTVLCLALPGAQAKDLGGRFGIGIEQSLGGVTGLTFRYWPSARFGINLTGGVDIISVDRSASGGPSGVALGFDASAGFTYNFHTSLHTNIGIGARMALGFLSEDAARLEDPSRTSEILQVGVEIPITLEFFFSDHFSISVATGITLSFVPSDGAALEGSGHGATTEPGAFSVGIGAGSVLGTLGVVYYF